MRYYPAYLSLQDRPVLVVGGGTVAARRLSALADAGARITLVAPQLCAAAQVLVDGGLCLWICDIFRPDHLNQQWLVIAATNDSAVNAEIARCAAVKQLFFNLANDAEASSFICPAVINQGDTQIAIASGGAAPVLTRLLKQRITAVLPLFLRELVQFSAGQRLRVKQLIEAPAQRRRLWERFFTRALNASPNHYASLLAASMEANATLTQRTVSTVAVELPEDLDQLTYGQLKLLHSADIALVENTLAAELEQLLRRDCQRIAPAHWSVSMAEAGMLVVRISRARA